MAPHQTNIVLTHAFEADADLESCQGCHGQEYQGMGRVVSCFSCHLAGPPFTIHPTVWDNIITDHNTFPDEVTTATCALSACHGEELSGGLAGPSCLECHLDGPPFTTHPEVWENTIVDHKIFPDEVTTATCALSACHGVALSGGLEGPSCFQCHTAGHPVDLGSCASCHNDPPDSLSPGGDTRPNRGGAHSSHDALPEVTGNCDLCHTGAGTNDANHFDGTEPADVSFPSTYDAKTGPMEYDAVNGICANVSCHGGKSTPEWLTETLDVGSDCISCHERGPTAQNTQFNSYFSGKHEEHVEDEGIECTTCHDPLKLTSSHFIGLDTATFEGAPAETIQDAFIYKLSAPQLFTCNAGDTDGCHGRSAGAWK